jgi:hypothetical protein
VVEVVTDDAAASAIVSIMLLFSLLLMLEEMGGEEMGVWFALVGEDAWGMLWQSAVEDN